MKLMTFKQALIIVHDLAAPIAATDEEIEALDEVRCHFETMWEDRIIPVKKVPPGAFNG